MTNGSNPRSGCRFLPRGRRLAVSSVEAVAGSVAAAPAAGVALELVFGVAADSESGVETGLLRVASDLLGRARAARAGV